MAAMQDDQAVASEGQDQRQGLDDSGAAGQNHSMTRPTIVQSPEEALLLHILNNFPSGNWQRSLGKRTEVGTIYQYHASQRVVYHIPLPSPRQCMYITDIFTLEGRVIWIFTDLVSPLAPQPVSAVARYSTEKLCLVNYGDDLSDAKKKLQARLGRSREVCHVHQQLGYQPSVLTEEEQRTHKAHYLRRQRATRPHNAIHSQMNVAVQGAGVPAPSMHGIGSYGNPHTNPYAQAGPVASMPLIMPASAPTNTAMFHGIGAWDEYNASYQATGQGAPLAAPQQQPMGYAPAASQGNVASMPYVPIPQMAGMVPSMQYPQPVRNSAWCNGVFPSNDQAEATSNDVGSALKPASADGTGISRSEEFHFSAFIPFEDTGTFQTDQNGIANGEDAVAFSEVPAATHSASNGIAQNILPQDDFDMNFLFQPSLEGVNNAERTISSTNDRNFQDGQQFPGEPMDLLDFIDFEAGEEASARMGSDGPVDTPTSREWGRQK